MADSDSFFHVDVDLILQFLLWMDMHVVHYTKMYVGEAFLATSSIIVRLTLLLY